MAEKGKGSDKAAKARSLLENLGQSMEELGRGLRSRRANEKKAAGKKRRSKEETASAPSLVAPSPAIQSTAPALPPFTDLMAPGPESVVEAPGNDMAMESLPASVDVGASSDRLGLVDTSFVEEGELEPHASSTSHLVSAGEEDVLAPGLEPVEGAVSPVEAEEAEMPPAADEEQEPLELESVHASVSLPDPQSLVFVPKSDPQPALEATAVSVELPTVPAFAVAGESPDRPASGSVVSDDTLATAWLADLDLEVEDSLEVLASIENDVHEDESLEDRLDPEFAATAQEETEELIPAIEASLARVASQGNKKDVAELSRHVHTLKGVAGISGAMRTRALIHRMETLMEEVQGGRVLDKSLHERLSDMFALVRQQMEALFRPAAAPAQAGESLPESVVDTPAPAPVKNVRIPADTIDRLFNEINEARLAGSSLGGNNILMRRKLREMEENLGRVSRMVRDLEMQAETQIQSRRAQLAENNEDFDPLEMDRFTLLQELSRLINEGISDVQDLHRDMARSVSDQETHLAYQERSIHEVQEGLLKTRLVPVEAVLNDRLHKVALSAARELGKSVSFVLSGGRVALDRAMLEKVIPPLEHILRNSVAHGIEMPQVRRELGKSAAGLVRVAVQQEAGRVVLVVEDDGGGLDVERIRAKAIEKGMWDPQQPMTDRQASDMICRPGFSTVETVTQIAGRGVGMDVVRSDVLAMGGRFDLATRAGRGLRVAIQLPTTVASASVMVVEAEGETWSIPTEVVDDVMIARGDVLAKARETGEIEVGGRLLPFSDLGSLMGVSDAATVPQSSAPLLLLSEGDRRVAVETHKLKQVAEVPLRPLGRVWAGIPGIVGSTLLPDGRASFLVDPLRAPWASRLPQGTVAPAQANRPPLVLVVDDSITVRKVTAQFLERNGYEPVLAKDGQEALEILAQVQPAAMLLDVEMPRMDGFDCAKNVRENPRHATLPILMITSRTASKHRDRAFSLGVDEYLGKPFREDELLELLEKYVAQGLKKADAPAES